MPTTRKFFDLLRTGNRLLLTYLFAVGGVGRKMTRPPRSGRMIHHRAPPCLASAASAAAFSGG